MPKTDKKKPKKTKQQTRRHRNTMSLPITPIFDAPMQKGCASKLHASQTGGDGGSTGYAWNLYNGMNQQGNHHQIIGNASYAFQTHGGGTRRRRR
jgi:hypothetical protein